MDDRILRERVYPLLRRAMGNYLAYVERGEDGRFHLPATHSPELATMPDANYDLALLRWGLETVIASADRLRIDDPLLPRWRDVLANLTPFPTDSAGLMVGRDRPWKESHRHYSHLLAIYPLGLIAPDQPEQRALIEKSLTTWERDVALFRGYSFTGGAAMHAWLGQGRAAACHAAGGRRVRGRAGKGSLGRARARCERAAPGSRPGAAPAHAAPSSSVAGAEGRSRDHRATPRARGGRSLPRRASRHDH